MKPDDIPDDVWRDAGMKFDQLYDADPLIEGGGEDMICAAIAYSVLDERARCATFALHGVRDGKSIVDFRPEAIHGAIMDGRDASDENPK